MAEPQVERDLLASGGAPDLSLFAGDPAADQRHLRPRLLVGYVPGTFNIDDKAVERAVNEVRGQNQEFAQVAPSGGALEAGRAGGQWLGMLIKAVLILLVIAGGVAIGNRLGGRRETGPSKEQLVAQVVPHEANQQE